MPEEILSAKYNPQEIEKKIYQIWEESGYFNPDNLPFKKTAKTFTIIMPPPNANGSLHIGHAVFVTLEDIMIRYHRMKQEKALWLPGADHAGFETQVVFEKKLEKEGQTRFNFDRDTLYKMIWEFTQKNKSFMENQLRQLGASCDWSREKFTLDKDIVAIVYKTFKKLHDDGLIYRQEKPVNWCVKHQTSLSDLEIKHTEQKGFLYYIKYGPITIATTRPETMFADTAVAVNPKDKRYKNLIGTKVMLPLTNRQIPIIADENVVSDFGTGALKITPAHDPLDFEIGQKHNLEILYAIDQYGRMTDLAQEFKGLKIIEARQKVVAKLSRENFIDKIDDYTHTTNHCYKCNNVIEPRILPQWFIKMDSLAKMGLETIVNKKIKFISKKFEKIYRHWLNNIRDWNISRQIVWGIQIPVWYCANHESRITNHELENRNHNSLFIIHNSKLCPPIVTDGTKPEKCPHCGSKNLIQDSDVFDTWFSSGQWPFATLQTNQKDDFKNFYPTSVMETGWDILFFWVARMIMLGIYSTKKIPFKTVYLHGLVRDKDKQKMSKSKGNVIDPLGIAEIYGTDALRIALVFGAGAGNDIIISEDKIRAMRNFATKIWNASRFIISKIDDKKDINLPKQKLIKTLTKDDKRILKKLKETIEKVSQDMENYKFGQAANIIYNFFWHEFCDKYIEQSKTQLQEKKLQKNTTTILLFVLINSLKLLHPFMPFITEEIYQKLPLKNLSRAKSKNKKLLMIEEWPMS